MIIFEVVLVLITLYVIYRICCHFLVTEKEAEKKRKIEESVLKTQKLKEAVNAKDQLSKETEELREMVGRDKTQKQ